MSAGREKSCFFSRFAILRCKVSNIYPYFVHFSLFLCTFALLIYRLFRKSDDACIDQISEHGANDGNYEKGLDGIVVFITHSTHVGHSIGGRTKTETT